LASAKIAYVTFRDTFVRLAMSLISEKQKNKTWKTSLAKTSFARKGLVKILKNSFLK